MSQPTPKCSGYPTAAQIKPDYASQPDWEVYAYALPDEYLQCIEEGLDIAHLKEVFDAVSHLPDGKLKKELGDALFDAVMEAPMQEGYPYQEPSDLDGIRALATKADILPDKDQIPLEDRIGGAILGRICGCMLGKTVEGIRSWELERFLKETDNFPMHRYITTADRDKVELSTYSYPLDGVYYADEIDGMPPDDDTNYIVLAQRVVADYGRDFTPAQVAESWLEYQRKDAYCTAERAAFCNFVAGYKPPYSAIWKNPYREWIGAQIRTDYYGYICPGDPQTAAEMAFRDASISHVKNGIYGAMFVSAMIATAAKTSDIEQIIRVGLSVIPKTCRLYEAIKKIMQICKDGGDMNACMTLVHEQYEENTGYGWCHTISNAMIVAASLLLGKGDYRTSVCMAVQAAYDTDCNGATVGSIIGMAKGTCALPEDFTAPIHGTLYTNIFGYHRLAISDIVETTIDHAND